MFPSMEPFTRELDMYPSVLQLFSRFDIAIAEVPFFGKRIDLLFASPTLSSLYSIEMKISNWRNAFKQAALNQLAAQRSFIALPNQLALRLFDRERRLFEQYNIGLIAVNSSARVLIPASRNEHLNIQHHRMIKRTLKSAKSKKPGKIGVIYNALTERSKSMVVLQTRAS